MLKLKKQEQGIISLEACIVLPIFIFVLMFFYGFMVFFSGHHLMSHSLLQASQSLSLDPFSTERIKTNWEETESGKDLIEALYTTVFTSRDEYFFSNEKWYVDDEKLMLETVKKRFLGFLVGSGTSTDVEKKADEKLKTMGIKSGLSGLDFSETKIEGNILTINVKYKQEFIFNFQGLAAFDRQQTISIALWDVG